MGCYFPGIYYAFYCTPVRYYDSSRISPLNRSCQGLRDAYMFGITMMFTAAIALQLHPEWGTARWHLRRILCYISVLAFGVSECGWSSEWCINNNNS